MTVFCDNYGCMFIDKYGFCDCDKLSIVGGVCEGSYHGGGNATENDAGERLKAENAKLREESSKYHDLYVHAIADAEVWHLQWSAEHQENAKLREAVATAIKVQAVLCVDANSLYCRKYCPLHRQESDDCLACDVIGIAQELGIEVDG